VFTAGIGEYLRVNEARVKLHVNARDVFSQNDRFQPTTPAERDTAHAVCRRSRDA